MKKLVLVLIVAVAAALMLSPGFAYANAAIHGGYIGDTDACAGCHRAHTSASSIQWRVPDVDGTTHYALLTSNASTIKMFCYACHDAVSQGADTNVQTGIYDGTLYGSNNATLNGGGFEGLGGNFLNMTSVHYVNDEVWGAFGGGFRGDDATAHAIGEGSSIVMNCTSCHDPHGSSNYRILKDEVDNGSLQYGLGVVGKSVV